MFAPSQVPLAMASDDRATLLALFLSNEGWLRADKWDIDAQLNKKYRIQADREGRVVKLILDNDTLRGRHSARRCVASTVCYAERSQEFRPQQLL